MARPLQPTGLTTEASSNSVIIRWVANSEPDVKGYNIYNSTTSGGGASGYVKLNDELITTYSEIQDVVTNSVTTVQIIGGNRVTTTTETVTPVEIFAYTHGDLLDTKTEYYVVTAVNNSDEESLYSIEIFDIPLILSTTLVEFPIRTTSDVTKSMIGNVLTRQPNIDVKPGTMTRDTHIDPHASEFGYLYTYIDFLSRSSSFLTLLEIDDPNNTGSSIAVTQSTYKQQLKAALQLTNDSDVQSVIDFSFDKLANNFDVFRKAATASVGEVVFYTQIKPLATITIPQGTVVSTTSTSAKLAINFQTLEQAQMLIGSIDSYFNDATQRYEITASVQALISGEVTNVGTNTINNSTFTQLQVTNVKPTQGGQDIEGNRSFASRAMLAFTGLDLGTKDGYLRTAIGTQYVQDVLIVDAGHVLMQRDYDSVRGEHAFGKVDIYFKGSVIVSQTETFGFIYKSNYRETVQYNTSITSSMSSATNMRVDIINPDVSIMYPAYLIQEIINVTKSDEFDLTGNFTIYKNAIEKPKAQYSLNLTTGAITINFPISLGDSVTADYEYKVPIVNEIVVASAIGGEVDAYLDANLLSKDVAILTDVIYLYRISTFAIDPATDILTIILRHVYHTGDTVNVAAGTTLPSPLVAGVTYYAIKLTNTTLKLATTLSNAQNGIAIDITTPGTGQLTIHPVTKTALIRDVDYSVYYKTVGGHARGQILFSFLSFQAGLVSGDIVSADYSYVNPIVGEVVIASASGNETTAQLAHGNVVESFIIEPNGTSIDINDTNAINSVIGIVPTDIIRVTYKYKKTDPAIFSYQPVDSINSVITSEGDVLQEGTEYLFNKVDDILLTGNSVHAKRSIQLLYDPSTGLPSGNLSDFSEHISLVGFEYKQLSKKGIDEHTITVTNIGATIHYYINTDYVLQLPATQFGYLSISRSLTSTITDGQTVVVSYKYGESVTVSYNTNSLVKVIQDKIEVARHITADVLVKYANRIDVDIEFTIKLKLNASSPVAIDSVSTALYTMFDQKTLGSRINQSDVIAVADDNSSIDYVILPLTKMVISNGTHIANEILQSNTIWTVYQVGITTSYRTASNTLRYKTAGSTSDISQFWRISANDVPLQLVNSRDEVANGLGRGFIDSDGSLYTSMKNGSTPAGFSITVAYNVSGETGSKDIVVTDLDYLNLKTLIIHTI
jgi:hypothetical protein